MEKSVADQFRQACSVFNIQKKGSIAAMVASLESSAHELARSQQVRQVSGSDNNLVADLRKLWRELARAQLTFWDGDDSETEEGSRHKNQQEDLRTLCISLSKFTRNLVAGIPENQTKVFDNEPDIRRLLHYYTSWSAMEDEKAIVAARVLTQALSNLVTSNDYLIAQLWETYLSLPEDQVVLMWVFWSLVLARRFSSLDESRLLGSPDARTLLTTLIFISNCIHDSKKRTKMLTKTDIGTRICISLLDDMLRLYDAAEGTEGAEAFDIGYGIFSKLIEENLIPDLYKKFMMQDEIITPHQTTLLKLVDSYLQANRLSAGSLSRSELIKLQNSLGPFVTKCFFTLSTYAKQSVQRALGQPGSQRDAQDNGTGTPSNRLSKAESPLVELDVMLPKACEALVLVTQCVTSICLDAEDITMTMSSESNPEENMKAYFNDARASGLGLVESLIELLRILDIFLPRINFGKPVKTETSAPSPLVPTSIPDGAGFSYLKRDLVRLLGVLCHKDRAVQDRTRDVGGIPVVMNLCVVDERNPYLREHALFTLRNILENNIENQKEVNSIKPSAEWDETGTLRERAGVTRK
ncbi:spinocerebellar ataxia type 10 protein domain-containing protein [Cyathus striatus]|nr:spinocerebellar ataxia type 10 protein domain-containing protein [Cyathus striatus]